MSNKDLLELKQKFIELNDKLIKLSDKHIALQDRHIKALELLADVRDGFDENFFLPKEIYDRVVEIVGERKE